MSERTRSAVPVLYHEPAGSYLSAWIMLGVIAVGFATDSIRGGRVAHWVGWLIAGVLIVGVNVLVISAGRAVRSITVTADRLQVGQEWIERDSIAGLDDRTYQNNYDRTYKDGLNPDAEPPARVLGLTTNNGLPRGVPGLNLLLVDGFRVAIPTKRPRELAAALDLPLPGVSDAGGAGALVVRPMEDADKPILAEIGNRTTALFRVAGVELPERWAEVALHDEAVEILVAGRPAEGLVRLAEKDGTAYIAALAVVPGVMRKGVGRTLLQAACSWAREHGYPAITVSTYADVPWNAPFFRANGFLDMDELPPELAALREWEREIGLDGPGPRVVLRLELG